MKPIVNNPKTTYVVQLVTQSGEWFDSAMNRCPQSLDEAKRKRKRCASASAITRIVRRTYTDEVVTEKAK